MTLPTQKPDCDAVPEVPRATEETWLGLTVASAILTLLAVLIAFGYVFLPPDFPVRDGSPDVLGAADRARAVTPFLAACGAAVTYFAVMWRGTINSRQANEQKRQNDSADEAELALLLDKAVGVLKSEDPRDAELAIAMLGTIALAPSNKYAAFALDLIIDSIVDATRAWENVGDRTLRRILTILQDAKTTLGREGSHGRTLDFGQLSVENDVVMNRALVNLMEALPTCNVRSLVLFLDPGDIRRLGNRRSPLNFEECRFYFIENADENDFGISIGGNCFDCVFHSFPVRRLDPRMSCNSLIRCDLSGMSISHAADFTHTEFESCFYDPDSLPYIETERDREAGERLFTAMVNQHGLDIQPRT